MLKNWVDENKIKYFNLIQIGMLQYKKVDDIGFWVLH